MNKETVDTIYSLTGMDFDSRKQFNDYCKELAKMKNIKDMKETLRELWNEGYIAVNSYGYVNFTKKGLDYLIKNCV